MTRTQQRITAVAYGALCHAFFLVGVATMIAAMYFGMSLSIGPFTGVWRWIANGALLAQFVAGHSLLLSAKGRAVMARLAPASLGRDLSTTTYALIASIQILLLFGLWSPTGVVWWHAEGATLVVLTLLYTIAWALLGKSMLDAGLQLQSGLLGWWAVARNKKPVYPPMPQTGLFRLTRQPIYVSFALTVWTVPTWTPDQLVVATTLTLYCVLGPLLKEARFHKIYGEAFEDYRRRTPYWLPWPRRSAPVQRLEGKHGQ
jgi:methanethiol S-methyltransferase